jgi:hypothetical protein
MVGADLCSQKRDRSRTQLYRSPARYWIARAELRTAVGGDLKTRHQSPQQELNTHDYTTPIFPGPPSSLVSSAPRLAAKANQPDANESIWHWELPSGDAGWVDAWVLKTG